MTRLYSFLAAIGAALAFVAAVFIKGRRAGIDSAAAKQGKRNDAIQKQFDAIDAGKPDLDGAVKRLRDRAGR